VGGGGGEGVKSLKYEAKAEGATCRLLKL